MAHTVFTILVTLFFAAGGGSLIVYFQSKGSAHCARIVALLTMLYMMLLLLMLGGARDWLFGSMAPDLNQDQSNLFLAGGGGVLAECAKWCKRLGIKTPRNASVAPVYLDCISGVLCGLAAVALAGAYKGGVDNMLDVEAGAAGIAGGWLGLGILDLAGVAYRTAYGLVEAPKDDEK